MTVYAVRTAAPTQTYLLTKSSGVARVQRLGAKLISRVPSSSFPPISPPFLSLLPSPSVLTFLPILFFSPSFLPKIQLGVWGSVVSSPAGLGAEPRLPKHFCHILRPEYVLVAMISVLFLHRSKYPSESSSTVLVATPHTWVMIITHRTCADLRIDPGEGWGSCSHLPPPPRGDATVTYYSMESPLHDVMSVWNCWRRADVMWHRPTGVATRMTDVGKNSATAVYSGLQLWQ